MLELTNQIAVAAIKRHKKAKEKSKRHKHLKKLIEDHSHHCLSTLLNITLAMIVINLEGEEKVDGKVNAK